MGRGTPQRSVACTSSSFPTTFERPLSEAAGRVRFAHDDQLQAGQLLGAAASLHIWVQEAARELLVGCPVSREHLNTFQDAPRCLTQLPGGLGRLVHVGMPRPAGADTADGLLHTTGDIRAPCGQGYGYAPK